MEFEPRLRKLTEDAAAELHRFVEVGAAVPPAVLKPACEECSLYRICLPEVTSRPSTIAQAAAELFRTVALTDRSLPYQWRRRQACARRCSLAALRAGAV